MHYFAQPDNNAIWWNNTDVAILQVRRQTEALGVQFSRKWDFLSTHFSFQQSIKWEDKSIRKQKLSLYLKGPKGESRGEDQELGHGKSAGEMKLQALRRNLQDS